MQHGSFRGLFAIAVTPFDRHGEIDFASISGLCDFYIGHGATAIIALGIMGEAHRLTAEEAAQLSTAFLKAADGRVPLYFGVSNAALRNSAVLARHVMSQGAAGVLLAPLANQRQERQVRSYLAAAIHAIGDDVPIILQDYPQETSTWLSAAGIGELIDAFPSLCALKHEDCPGLAKISFLRSQERSVRVRTLPILSGNGALYLPQELARGANGAMTGFSYPETIARVCELFDAGERAASEDLFDRFLPLLRHEQQPQMGLAIRKYVLERRGAIACRRLREPGYELSAIDCVEIDALIARLERGQR